MVEATRRTVQYISGQSEITERGLLSGMGLVIETQDEIDSGKFSIPEDACGIKVTTADMDVLNFDGKDYVHQRDDIYTIYAKEESVYTKERVIAEFGENSELYQEMVAKNSEFVLKFNTKPSEEDNYGNMANYAANRKLIVLAGTDGQYKQVKEYQIPEDNITFQTSPQLT